MSLDSRNKRAAAVSVSLPWRVAGQDPATTSAATESATRAAWAGMSRSPAPTGEGATYEETLTLTIGAELALAPYASLGVELTLEALAALEAVAYPGLRALLALDVDADLEARPTLGLHALLELDVEAELEFLPAVGVEGDLQLRGLRVQSGVAVLRRARTGLEIRRAAQPGIALALDVIPGEP